MPFSPLAVVPPLIEGGVQLVIGLYRDVAPTHIIKKADEKYDQGIDVLEEYRPFMTPDQIQEIINMAQRVEAARPPYPSGSTTLLDLLRHPFNRINVARKYKRVCKEYLHLVKRTSQLARNQAVERDVLLAWGESNGMLSRGLGPMTEASVGSGSMPTARLIEVSPAVALEIERAAGPGEEMSVKFRDVKLSVGTRTSINLLFTPAGITVDLGLFQLPSLVRREEGVAPAPGTSAESRQGEVTAQGGYVPHVTTSRSNALARNPSVISMSGTATIFPRQKDSGNLSCGDLEGTRKKDEHKTKVGGGGGKVIYGLRFDNLEYHAETDAAPTKDDDTAV